MNAFDLRKNRRSTGAEGDLKENAEYHATRKSRHDASENQLAQIQTEQGPHCRHIDASTRSSGFWRERKLKDSWGDEEVYTLVGAGDEDYENGKILSSSPFGVAIMGKKVGETVEIAAPRGTLKYEVLSIEFED